MPNLLKYCILIVALGISIFSIGQNNSSNSKKNKDGTNQAEPKKEKVKLIRADALEGSVIDGTDVRILKGNVIFKQGDAFMYCDSAYQYMDRNSLDAFGHVKIDQEPTMILTGNTLHYNGNTKLAKVKGNVVFKDGKMTLTTDQLNYNLNTKVGSYTTGGKIVDDKNVLTSEKGYYFSKSKYFGFKDSVTLVNDNYTIECDTLEYSSATKVSYFKGPTNIKTKDGNLYAEDGEYNTITGQSYFSKRAALDNEKYNLLGDSLHYNEELKIGYARGDVELTLKQSGIIIYADIGTFNEKSGISKSYGNTMMKYAMGRDTMYLIADTLISIQDSQNLKRLDAFYNVRIYKSDMKAKCDSMSYLVTDSMILYYDDPVIWADASQITGEEIKVQLANSAMDKMYVTENAFMVSVDSLQNYNQIKGTDMIAHFDTSDLYRLDVNGNGQSLYYALENDTALVGLNKTICTNMVIKLDSSKVKYINFLQKPDATFIPPQKIVETDNQLNGFMWRKEEEPLFEEFAKYLPPVKLKLDSIASDSSNNFEIVNDSLSIPPPPKPE